MGVSQASSSRRESGRPARPCSCLLFLTSVPVRGPTDPRNKRNTAFLRCSRNKRNKRFREDDSFRRSVPGTVPEEQTPGTEKPNGFDHGLAPFQSVQKRSE